jgi:hypothetical protein
MAGKLIADQIEHSTAGSLDTSYVVQGSAKALVNFSQDGTQAIRNSTNISSLSDAGTGQTSDISFTSSMADSIYFGSFYANANTSGLARNHFSNQYAGGFGDKSTSSFGTYSYDATGRDGTINDVIIFGDLA